METKLQKMVNLWNKVVSANPSCCDSSLDVTCLSGGEVFCDSDKFISSVLLERIFSFCLSNDIMFWTSSDNRIYFLDCNTYNTYETNI